MRVGRNPARAIALVGIVLIALPALSEQNEWDQRRRFEGGKRERAVGFSIGNFGYICLGQDTAELMHRDLWQYDPTTDIWTQKADFGGQGRRDAVAFVINNKGYVGTGINHYDADIGTILSDFWEYDPNNNTWTPKAPIQGGALYFGTGFSANGKGYVCGGKYGPNQYSNSLYEYDAGSNFWMQRAPFPGGDRYNMISFVVNDKAYVGTGTDHDIYRRDLWEYSPTSNTWLPKADLPGSERSAASAFVLGNLGYVMFGTNGGYLNDLWEFDPGNNSWTARASYPSDPRRGGVAFAIGNRAYAGCGKSQTGVRRNWNEYYPIWPNGIEEPNSANIKVYPNPVGKRSVLYVDIGCSIEVPFTFSVYSLEGKMLHTQCYSGSQIPLGNIIQDSGTYFFMVTRGALQESTTPVLSSGKLVILRFNLKHI